MIEPFEQALVSICRDWFGMTGNSSLSDVLDGIGIRLIVETLDNRTNLHSAKFVDPIRSEVTDFLFACDCTLRVQSVNIFSSMLEATLNSGGIYGPIIKCIAQP